MKKSLVILMTAVLLVLMLPPLGQRVFAAEYTVTWDPNGGTPGQQWKNTEIVTYSETAAPEPWWTPNYSEEVCAPPAGMTFDAYDVGGQRVAAVTAIQPNSLIKQDTTIKYLWKPAETAETFTLTFDANGGEKGPDWVDSMTLTEWADWCDFLPHQNDSVVKAPAGKEFDCYEVGGQKMAAVTSTKIIPKGDAVFRYIWRDKSSELYVTDKLPDIYKKKSLKPLIFKFRRSVSDDLTFDLFRSLKIDGVVIDRKLYFARKGSLEIELTGDYLEAMPDGDHTLQPVFEDGDGPVVTFTIGEKSSPAAGTGVPWHEHDYVWQVEKEATPTIDGEMIYVCRKCGSVSQRLTITGYVSFNKDLADRIRAAQPGAEIKVETDKWISLYAISLDELAKRPDVSVKIDFRHQGKRYEVVIPAGTDAAALKDENGYAGFLFLGSKFGLTEITK